MKKILSLFVFLPIMVFGQTQTENYIINTTYKDSTKTSIDTPTITQANQSITYFDGLGRPIQQIAHQQSGSGKDIVTPIEYDAFGRQIKDYLPYVPNASASLDYKTNALTDVLNFPQYSGQNPFSQKEFEASPLNRVMKQAAPGTDWALGSGHEIKFDYQTNADTDLVRNFGVSFTGGNTESPYLDDRGVYAANQLYKTITKDENWSSTQTNANDNTTQEFKDKEGRVVLKRTFNQGIWHDTNYVYDNFGNLTYVLPPNVVTHYTVPAPGSYTNEIFQRSFFSYEEYFDFFTTSEANDWTMVETWCDLNYMGVDISLFRGANGTTLRSGKILDLQLDSYSLNIPLGDIMLPNAQGVPVLAGTAYLINGVLYCQSTGVIVYPPNNYTISLSFDAQNFQPNTLPPPFNTTDLDGLCYQYKYDSRNRLVEKKLPGKQWEFIVYDKLDRPVATGPAFSPFGDGSIGWLITKYDVFSRVVYTGWQAATVTSATRLSLQNDQNNLTTANYETKTSSGTIDNIPVYYTNTVSPTSFKLLTVNYYDDYNFPNAPSPVPTSVLSDSSQAVYYNNTQKPIGLPTGSWVRVLQTPADNNGESSYTLYDKKARPVRSYTKNYLSPAGYTYTDTKIDFSGKVLLSETYHKRQSTDPELKTTEVFTYSPQDRLLTHTHQINNQAAQLLAENTYDELGQLTSKNVGNTIATPLQKVDYAYNIRGWLTGINNDPTNNLVLNTSEKDLFSFKINYNSIVGNIYRVKPLYNGNISETYWRTASDDVLRKYGYEYDNLNRLTNAFYQKPGGNTFPTYSDYSERNITYDKNGNIKTLVRNGDLENALPANEIDYLNYTYKSNSNQLTKVFDYSANTSGFNDGNTTGDDYTYDANGNLIKDLNKNITEIIYNHLNLPTKITFGATGTISYIYNAVGQKLEKQVVQTTPSSTTVTNYLGGYQYKNNILQFFPTAEGYYDLLKNSYVFNYTDHLGNVRLSYEKDATTGSLKILEESNYYPFGLKHKGYNSNNAQPNYKYKFQGQERQDELGLNWDSFKWRNYDMAIGRFMSVDPLAEKYAYQSPYNFSENRVIDARELEGLEAEILFNKSTHTLRITPDKSKWNPNLPTKSVSALQYNPNETKFNQVVKVKNVFTGGKATDGVVERDPERPQQQPIPNGTYDILDNDDDTKHNGWFRLDKQDFESYNDKDDVSDRDGFRFHLGTESWGCVTCDVSKEDRTQEWSAITKILNSTTTETVPEKRGNQGWNPFSWLTKFGTLTVIGEDTIKEKKKDE